MRMASAAASSEEEEEEEAPELVDPVDPVAPTVPVTVVCGFLGSGKSTLLQSLLMTELRLAMVTNEFAETGGLESALIELGADLKRKRLGTGEEILELRSGCVCCAVKDELAQTVENLVVNARGRLDAVIVELSGIANPGPVAASFWLDETLESRVKLDGVVCVVDLRNHPLTTTTEGEKSKFADEARRQVAFADRILLNKRDLVDEDRLRDTEAVVRKLNPTAQIAVTTRGRGDYAVKGWLLDANCYGYGRGPLFFERPGAFADLHHHQEGGGHFAAFGSVRLEGGSAPCDSRRLTRFLGELLWEKQDTVATHDDIDVEGTNIFRVKGLLDVTFDDDDDDDDDERTTPRTVPTVVQGVGDLFDLQPVHDDDGDVGKKVPDRFLVFIGTNLDEGDLRRRFRDTLL